MAEFSEVIKQFKRMCKSISAAKCTRGECSMGREFGCENISQCRKIAFEAYDEFELRVMKWAAEHPVIYPTWDQWLATQGVRSYDDLDNHIPADIAEKLGIEPKENV